MAPLHSCAAEHDRAGVGPVDGSREAIGGEFRNETCDGPEIRSLPADCLVAGLGTLLSGHCFKINVG